MLKKDALKLSVVEKARHYDDEVGRVLVKKRPINLGNWKQTRLIENLYQETYIKKLSAKLTGYWGGICCCKLSTNCLY